jgi:hypothetical protein
MMKRGSNDSNPPNQSGKKPSEGVQVKSIRTISRSDGVESIKTIPSQKSIKDRSNPQPPAEQVKKSQASIATAQKNPNPTPKKKPADPKPVKANPNSLAPKQPPPTLASLKNIDLKPDPTFEAQKGSNQGSFQNLSPQCMTPSAKSEIQPSLSQIQQSPPIVAGLLTVNLTQAKLSLTPDQPKNLNPFCMLKIGQNTQKSNYPKSVSEISNPNWDESFNFRIHPTDQDLLIELWDTTMVGSLKIHLSQITQNHEFSIWAPLTSLTHNP